MKLTLNDIKYSYLREIREIREIHIFRCSFKESLLVSSQS